MKQAAIGTSFLVILFTLPVLGQTPDTTSAWRYFPLEIGNVWEYESNYYACPQGCGSDELLGYRRWMVVRDSVLDGVRYFVLREEEFSAEGEVAGLRDRLVRFDASVARGVERFENGAHAPWPSEAACRLDSPFGGMPDCGEYEGYYEEVYGGYDHEVYIGDDFVVTAMKGFVGLASEVRFGADLGYLGMSGGKASVWEDELVYARVGGIEYGTRIPVAAEAPPPKSAIALSTYPNPSHNVATVRFSLDQAQRVALAVFDVLGRRVLAADLGAQPAGEASHRLDLAALPAGVYVVRLDGDAGATATTRIVRQ
jgi:hypothetical protein